MTITTVDVFMARESWVGAPRNFIAQIASLLESPAKAQEFCLLVEDLGVMHKIIALASGRPETETLALLLAVIICSGAYVAAKKDDYHGAEFMWDMALSFYPTHLPSKAGLAVLNFNKENYVRALKYADEVIQAYENPGDLRDAMSGLVSGEYESEAAKGMGMPDIVGCSQSVLEQMRMIRNVIHQENANPGFA